MSWRRDEQLEYLLRLPWSVALAKDSDGDWVASVRELPFLSATGATDREVGRELFLAVTAALDAMLEHGDPLPLPAGGLPPWETGVEAPARKRVVLAGHLGGEGWQQRTFSDAESFTLSA